MTVIHTSNLVRIAWTQLQKISLCEVASFQTVYRTRRGVAEEKTSS